MKKRKTIIFDGEKLFLKVNSYMNNGRMAIIAYTDEELYGDITINLPYSYLENDKEGFIEPYTKMSGLENRLIKLGIIEKVIDNTKYNYGEYDRVRFNLEKLKEYDPEGVTQYERMLQEENEEDKEEDEEDEF